MSTHRTAHVVPGQVPSSEVAELMGVRKDRGCINTKTDRACIGACVAWSRLE